jgi:hypothetical protein
MKPGLEECENAVIVPHIASATLWTRAGMVGALCCAWGSHCLLPACMLPAWPHALPGCTGAPVPLPQSTLNSPHTPAYSAPQATLAACNVAATLQGYPAWTQADVLPFVDGPFEDIPKAAPSIVNAKELNLKTV